MFCRALPPRPKPCPPPCGCAESTSRFRAPTWVRFSLRRWGLQPPSASCHPTPPFGRGWVTLRFRVFGGRHRLLLLSVVSRVTLRCSPGYPSHYSAPQVTKPAISPKTLAAANPSFLREKLHPLRSAPTARRFRHSHSHPPPSGAFLPPIRDAPCLHGGVLPRTCPQPRGRTLHPAADIGGQPRHYAAAANHRASVCHAPPLGAFLPPIRGVSFTSRRSTKRRDGKIDCCWLPSNDVVADCKLDFTKPRLTTFVGFCSQNLTKPTF